MIQKHCPLIVLAAICLMGALQNSAAAAADWKEFSSAECKFKCLFPISPREKQATVKAAGGELKTHAFIAEVDVHTAYGVDYTEYPPGMKLVANKQTLDRAEASVVTKYDGKVTFQQDTKVGNYPAREFEYVAGGKANYSGRMKIIIVGQRVYELLVIFLPADPHPADRDRFLQSFQIQD